MDGVTVNQRVRIPNQLTPRFGGMFAANARPHGPGVVRAVQPSKYEGGAPMVTVQLDSGETVTVSRSFLCEPEQAA